MYIEKEEEKNTEHNGLRSYHFRSNNLQNHVLVIPILLFCKLHVDGWYLKLVILLIRNFSTNKCTTYKHWYSQYVSLLCLHKWFLTYFLPVHWSFQIYIYEDNLFISNTLWMGRK